jgi:L-malate glycosyltransferase
MPDKLKILHIIKSLGRGGAEMLLPETLKLHDQSKFEFHYIYFLPWKDQMVPAIQANEGVVTCLAASNNIKIMLKVSRVVRYIKENRIQVVHCHLPWAGMVGRVVHRLTKIPVLYTEHNKQERYHFLTRWMNKFTFNWQSGVIAVSKDVADSIQQNIGPQIPVHEILNGVNTEHFKRNNEAGKMLRRQLDIPENALVIGTVAVFRFQKRIKEWLEVFALVAAKNSNLYGIIVGDGILKGEIVKHREALGLERKVIMPGLQTEVIPWYSAMDIFMMTSIFEGLPIALLEAMSMECAIATTDAGGIKEVVKHNESGVMVSVENWKKLEVELNRLVDNEPWGTRLGQSARARVKEAFGMERMVRELEGLYMRYLNHNHQ